MKDITLRISGSITIGKGDIQIHHLVRQALLDGYDIILLDLENVNYMDSSAVGEVAACFISAQNKGARIALTHLQPKIKKLFQIMTFLDMIPNFDDNETALAALKAEAKGQT